MHLSCTCISLPVMQHKTASGYSLEKETKTKHIQIRAAWYHVPQFLLLAHNAVLYTATGLWGAESVKYIK